MQLARGEASTLCLQAKLLDFGVVELPRRAWNGFQGVSLCVLGTIPLFVDPLGSYWCVLANAGSRLCWELHRQPGLLRAPGRQIIILI